MSELLVKSKELVVKSNELLPVKTLQLVKSNDLQVKLVKLLVNSD